MQAEVAGMPAAGWRRHLAGRWPWLAGEARPVVVIGVALIVSRAAAFAAGVRFDTSLFESGWQFVDPELLHHRLLQSVYYFHNAPPAFNLAMGVLIKVFPGSWATATHVLFVGAGVVLALVFYALLRLCGIRTWPAVIGTLVLTASPTALMYEDLLFYEYPVCALLVVCVGAGALYLRRPSFALASAFLWLSALLIYTRSMFQIIWLFIAMGFLLIVTRPGVRKMVLLASIGPLVVVGALYAKNIIVFGVPSTTSWLGPQLAKVTVYELPTSERDRLVANGTLSRFALVPDFSPLASYRALGLIGKPKPRGIPVLDNELKSNGSRSLNQIAYVDISKHELHDALAAFRADPIFYFRTRKSALIYYFRPSTDYPFLSARNRSSLRPYDRVFNALFYWRIGRTGLGLWAAYLLALGYGFVLFIRTVRAPREVSLRTGIGALAWVALTYVFLVVNLLEIGENQRDRIDSDPFALLIVILALSAAAGSIQRRRSATNAAQRPALP
jgi:hypothetical protein